MAFKLTSRGNYSKTKDALKRLLTGDHLSDLDSYGREGLRALADATPVDTGLTAASWDYRITHTGIWVGIVWFNTNQAANGESVAVLVQYGHATRGGTYISGYDYINPAMRPVFDKIVDNIWKKVKS